MRGCKVARLQVFRGRPAPQPADSLLLDDIVKRFENKALGEPLPAGATAEEHAAWLKTQRDTIEKMVREQLKATREAVKQRHDANLRMVELNIGDQVLRRLTGQHALGHKRYSDERYTVVERTGLVNYRIVGNDTGQTLVDNVGFLKLVVKAGEAIMDRSAPPDMAPGDGAQVEVKMGLPVQLEQEREVPAARPVRNRRPPRRYDPAIFQLGGLLTWAIRLVV